MSKKVTVEDLGLKFDGMPEAQAAFLRKCAEMVVNVVNKSNEGQLTDEQFMEKMNTALKPFAGIDNESIQSLIKENSELQTLTKSLGEKIAKLEEKGISTDFVSKFDESFNEMYDSESFQKFAFQHGASAKALSSKTFPSRRTTPATATLCSPVRATM